MQVPDAQKEMKILAAAAELFVVQPFHKVLLSDVAEAAGVGKGTLYVYFKSKEDLYMSVLYSGFDQLVERMQRRLNQSQIGPVENLEAAISEMVQFAYQNPHMFELMRTVPRPGVFDKVRWDSKREELRVLLVSIIRRGIASGEFFDPHPDLTARFIPGLVRSALMENPQSIDARTLTRHILRFVRVGLQERPP
ncbi:MAG: TetR/AcrR family transcriptional regulator [Desulfobacterales bacterium]